MPLRYQNHSMNRFQKLCVHFFCFFGIFFLIHAVSAISVSPVVVTHDLEPGGVVSDVISIKNTNDRSERYVISTQNFIAEGEDGRQLFLDQQASFGLAEWIATDESEVTLAPNEVREIRYQIQVPQNATPGGQYAAVFFSVVPLQGQSGSVGVQGKVGVLFLVRVSGDVVEKVSVESFGVTSHSPQSRLPVIFETRVRNDGNVHLEPEGVIRIRNIFGAVTREILVNQSSAFVLPGSVRRFEAEWKRPGSMDAGAGFLYELKREWEQFAFGRYTAEVDATVGKTRQPLHAVTTFWIFPWRLVLVGAAVLIFAIVCVRIYARMTIHAALRKRRSPKRK